jgi:DNA-binding response OmpR family regulator
MNILIVEDNVTILNALQQSFRYKQVGTEGTVSGLEALEKLKNKYYDIAIIDLGLPDLNGEEVIKEARAANIPTPMLVLTASKNVDTKARLLETGIDDYIEKPYSFDELFARISAILRRRSMRFPSEYLKIADLELLPENHTCMRGGKKIHLRNKEYALLKYLMQNPNRAISRQELVEKIWGDLTAAMSNTLDAHVFHLRQKIDKGFNKELIKTIHGFGYMMAVDS